MTANSETALHAKPVARNDREPVGVFADLAMLIGALRSSPQKAPLAFLTAAIVGVVVATVIGQIRLNAWHQPFYDALAQRDLGRFVHQLLVFGAIATALLVLNVAQTWLHEMLKMRLRAGATNDLVRQWLMPGRASKLAWSGTIAVNPDQRIHEDTRHLTELWVDMAVGLFQSALLLASFTAVLWILSRDVVFTYADRTFAIPGYMVWCALLYAATGSWLSWRVGRPLIAMNAERYAREADLRFLLVHTSEHADAIALYRGEKDEHLRLRREVDSVLSVMRQLVGAHTRLTWVTAGYGWFAIVAPVVVAAPGYFSGELSFGRLMMVVGAFFQVQQALRWFVDNFSRIADWRATLLRVAAFRRALIEVEAPGRKAERIELVAHPDRALAFEDLRIVSGTGSATLNAGRIEIAPGERILIVGGPGIGKSALFRAMAGLWPWGRGRISLPPRDGIMFLPQRPYIPIAPLRAILSYPKRPAAFADGVLIGALQRTGLSHLVGQLDSRQRWDKELSVDEQQRIAIARALLHRPQWLILDEVIDAIDTEHRRRIRSLFEDELAETTVVSLGRHARREGFYTRILRMTRHTNRAGFAPPDSASPALAPAAAGTGRSKAGSG
ncbi:ABC transporter ATP-binding protein/permease [Chelatococcus sp. SYSU_G07232]|uniref:ABC transporter ATP-binding protein/permease n=1 Tax=Chelatococcus albus TaxID=3047466 RepID=A0ABT7AFC6_9HYPH|nr:ABC transporter ATP-binding protein/permease [Chelatococcus sp. SYSU_G07232]MDJ1158056.1 ABC transporter ATP-binding protein/permease [Chelatococcus sp. SYSU_G07232]